MNYTGTFVVDFTITIRSYISTQTPLYCDLFADSGGDSNAYAGIQKYNFVEATRSGSSATCKLSLPYYVSLQYALAAGGVFGPLPIKGDSRSLNSQDPALADLLAPANLTVTPGHTVIAFIYTSPYDPGVQYTRMSRR